MRMESGMRVAGKRAVVTGGASGIGRASALRLGEEGAEVLVGDVDEAGGAALAQGSGGRITFQRTDVTKFDDIAAMVATADAAGGLDILVNNAGAGGARDPIDTITPEDWDRTQALLLRLVAMGIRHAAPLMAARRSEEHTSELQSLMRNSYAVFCLKKKKNTKQRTTI